MSRPHDSAAILRAAVASVVCLECGRPVAGKSGTCPEPHAENPVPTTDR